MNTWCSSALHMEQLCCITRKFEERCQVVGIGKALVKQFYRKDPRRRKHTNKNSGSHAIFYREPARTSQRSFRKVSVSYETDWYFLRKKLMRWKSWFMGVIGTDEKLFFFLLSPNRQNDRYWADANPREIAIGKKAHGSKVMAWVGIIEEHVFTEAWFSGSVNGEG